MSSPQPPLRRRAIFRMIGPLVRRVLYVVREHRASQFTVLGAPAGKIVFLGDSITEGGLWNEWFPSVELINRGIGGDLTRQVLARLDTAINEPVAVLLLIGTNDLGSATPIDVAVDNVEAILDDIERRAPGTPVVLQSVMPRSLRFRDEVLELNRRYVELVERRDKHVSYLDLWPALATVEGELQSAFSLDRLHLNGHGYAAWVEVLRPVVDNFARR